MAEPQLAGRTLAGPAVWWRWTVATATGALVARALAGGPLAVLPLVVVAGAVTVAALVRLLRPQA